MNAILCRRQERKAKVANPFPLKYRVVVGEDSNGKPMYEESQPVAPSLAEDFSVTNNAIYAGLVHGVYKMQSDPVDLQNNLEKLI